METFSKAREFVDHPGYMHDRSNVLSGLRLREVDAPIRDIVEEFGKLPECFTLQCCYGHFVWEGQADDHNLDLLPLLDTGLVRYRIAYLALCIEKGERGAFLREQLAALCEIDADYIQFGSPLWFWNQFPNSYALQVEPNKFVFQDEAMLEHAEALHVQAVRDLVYKRVRELLFDINQVIFKGSSI